MLEPLEITILKGKDSPVLRLVYQNLENNITALISESLEIVSTISIIFL